MATFTQDIVLNIPGGETLLQKTNIILKNKNVQIDFIKDGFQAHVEGLPYYFQVSYYAEIGWNVFLSSISGNIEDDKETDKYYFKLEHAVDMVNLSLSKENDTNPTTLPFLNLIVFTPNKTTLV